MMFSLNVVDYSIFFHLASCLKVGEWRAVCGLQDFSDSPSPLGPNLGFELGLTGLGLGLGGFGTKGLGPGL